LRLLTNPGNGLEAPRGAAPRPELPMVQGHSNRPEGRALAAEPLNFRQRRLLTRFRFQMLAVLSEPGAERDIADAMPLAPLVAQRVASPFPPMASRSHWLTAPMIVITRRPAAEPVSSDSATEIRATFRFSTAPAVRRGL
jgi:hypothetical protein